MRLNIYPLKQSHTIHFYLHICILTFGDFILSSIVYISPLVGRYIEPVSLNELCLQKTWEAKQQKISAHATKVRTTSKNEKRMFFEHITVKQIKLLEIALHTMLQYMSG